MKRQTEISNVVNARAAGPTAIDDFAQSSQPPAPRRPSGRLTQVKISEINRGPNKYSKHNPRKSANREGVEELAANIQAIGLLQPIVLLAAGSDGLYPLVSGERRILAHEHNGEEYIDAIIKTVDQLKSDRVFAGRVSENLQREGLAKDERAYSVRDLIEMGDLSASDAAEQLGKTEGWVSQQLSFAALLDLTADAIKLDPTSASSIMSLPENKRLSAVETALADEGPMRQRVRRAVDATRSNPRKPAKKKTHSQRVTAAIEGLSATLQKAGESKPTKSQLRSWRSKIEKLLATHLPD